MSKTNLAILSIILSGILYGSLGVLGTWVRQAGFSVHNMLFWRFFTAGIIILFLGGRGWRVPTLSRAEASSLLVNSLFYSISCVFYFHAIASIGTGLGMVIFFSYPFFIFLWLWLFMKQKISLFTWLSLLAIVIGFFCISKNFLISDWNPYGIVLALLSCILYAAYIVQSSKLTQRLNPYFSTFALCLGSSLYFFVHNVIMQDFQIPSSLNNWLVLLSLGFFATTLPVLLMLQGLRYIGADKAAVLSVFEPIVTVILGFVFLNETLTLLQFIGIILVLTGAVCSAKDMKK
ncbi:MAG: EamA family transporter [Oligoflexales bacterium]|nr:EamA family transporter [Oligoflexales bacterium]